MFVKKLVEIASRKGNVSIAGLKAEDVKPRLAFHYGVPPEASTMAYDSIQHILAVSTRYGVIKLFGRGNTQAVLQSEHTVPSKFLQFIKNKGILLNVTVQNHVEVWDIDKKQLACEHKFDKEITCFNVISESFFMYVGDSFGNVSVFHLDSALLYLVQMQYIIPFSESHCKSTEAEKESAVVYISPQPLAESKRVLIIFKDGLIALWGIQENKVIFSTGGNLHHQSHHEAKIVTSASWACAFGSKVVAGYSTGDIFLWSVPVISDQHNSIPDAKKDPYAAQHVPLLKLNLSYKMDKIPIVSLKWFGGDGKTSRLYINGFSDLGASHSLQVIILNENSESRIVKLALSLPEPCFGMEHVSYLSEKGKHKTDALVILLKSGNISVYDDSEIEHYLLHSQSKSSSDLPNHLHVRLPYADPSITAAKLYSGQCAVLSSVNEDPASLAKTIPDLFQFNVREKDANHSSTSHFNKFSRISKLLITGHTDGTLNIWETSCPLLQLVLSIKHKYDQNSSSSMAAVTALHFDIPSQILLSGYQSGLIRIIKFKKEKNASENVFSFLQAKPGDNYIDEVIKVEGAITSINLNPDRQHLAVGTEKGFVALIQLEGTSILYQKQISSQLYSGIASLQFEKYGQNGLEKDVLLVGMEDSSVFAVTEDSGQSLTGSSVHPKKPSRALLMHVLDSSLDGACISDSQDTTKVNSLKEALQKHSLLLLCSEDAIRLYTLSHVFQGIKKVYNKKKLNDRCCYATILYGPLSNIALMLIFACGKIEIRSLPDLSLLNEISLRGLTFPASKPHPNACKTLYASSEGDLLLVDGDQAILFLSFLSNKEGYRHLDYFSKVYTKNLVAPEEETSYYVNNHKEKKKGIFSMIVKDLKGGGKTRDGPENASEGPRTSISEELFSIFSTVNFSFPEEKINATIENSEDVELDIDDIEIEDAKEEHKGLNIGSLSKQKLGKKFQALKGIIKQKVEENMRPEKNRHEQDKVVTAVDQVKQKYGYRTTDESNTAKMAANRLSENVTKLQGISLRTSEMQDTAQSFQSMATELLRITKNEKSS